MRTTTKQPALLWERVTTLAGRYVKHFRTDLDHDKRWIVDNPGIPFLHATRETGTTLVELLPVEMLPGPGVFVPYIFGTANAERIARRAREWAEAVTCPGSLPNFLYLYFDGQKLRKITEERFREVARDYASRMAATLRKREHHAR